MRSLIVIVLAFACVTASSATLTGRTVRVTDGDTLVILSEGNVQHKIRLQGVDAPERGQAYGAKSKEYFSERVAGRFVVVKIDKRDRYSRVIGKVLVGGKDVCEVTMLILTRRPSEILIIELPTGERIEVTVLGIKGNQVRIGTAAPDNISILREGLPAEE
jgi:carbon storage regulator CsrA